METWILHSIRKSWRRMSGRQFVTSKSSALGLCSRTMIPNTPASPHLNGSRKTKLRFYSGQSGQSPGLNPIEMLWHDLKQSIHARKPSNVAELKQFCKEEWAKIPPQWYERLMASYVYVYTHAQYIPIVYRYITNIWLQLPTWCLFTKK